MLHSQIIGVLFIFLYYRYYFRLFAHGAMYRRIELVELFLIPIKCSMIGVTKAVVCVVLSVVWCI